MSSLPRKTVRFPSSLRAISALPLASAIGLCAVVACAPDHPGEQTDRAPATLAYDSDDPTSVMTSPSSGGWYNIGDAVTYSGDTADLSVAELQYYDFDKHAWAHASDVTATGDSFVNGNGETRYGWTTRPLSFSYPRPYWVEPGPTRDDGQRAVASYWTVWGWGGSPDREDGHYITAYMPCGREGQGCCHGADSLCDDDLACSRDCSGSNECGQDLCKPKAAKPKQPEPQGDPKPQQPHPTESCGQVGQPCCGSQHSCNDPGSACAVDSSGTFVCQQPGVDWHLSCTCDDGYNYVSFDVHACYQQDAQNPPFSLTCSQIENKWGVENCVFTGAEPPSGGHCFAAIGNFTATPK